MYRQIPVTILTGFLGSGKTTLLNRLLKDPALKDTAVIVNEFGEIGLDHLLVEQANEGIIELSDGCLCCTIRGELVDTLADLVDRMQTGRIGALRRIVIETTGLADPVPVMQAVLGHPVLHFAVSLDGIVTTVDAVNAMATLDAHEEAVRQAAVADRIVVTKTDLAGADETQALLRRLKALNPSAPIIQDAALVPAAALVDCGPYDPRTKNADVARWLEDGADGAGHHDHDHHDHGHHHHDVNRHDAHIRSFSLVHDKPVDKLAVAMFIDLMASAHGDKLLRMKGIVELSDDPERPVVLQGVQRIFHPPVRLEKWPDETRGTRIVVIVKDLEEDFVRRIFSAFTDTPATDTPDRQALESNPLAIPGYAPGR